MTTRDTLTQDACVVLDSLEERPEFSTPQAIAASPMVPEQVDLDAVVLALRELRDAGLVTESFGTWSLVT